MKVSANGNGHRRVTTEEIRHQTSMAFALAYALNTDVLTVIEALSECGLRLQVDQIGIPRTAKKVFKS